MAISLSWYLYTQIFAWISDHDFLKQIILKEGEEFFPLSRESASRWMSFAKHFLRESLMQFVVSLAQMNREANSINCVSFLPVRYILLMVTFSHCRVPSHEDENLATKTTERKRVFLSQQWEELAQGLKFTMNLYKIGTAALERRGWGSSYLLAQVRMDQQLL